MGRFFKCPAFTLSEVLIALAILGVISTFTINKLLHDPESNQKKAIFRECYASVSQALQDGLFNRPQNIDTYMLNKLSGIKTCPVSVNGQGCYTMVDHSIGTQQPGIVMTNGAVIWGFLPTRKIADGAGALEIDWNGDKGPNERGKDILVISTCFDPQGTLNCSTIGGMSERAGTLTPYQVVDTALYQEVFQ
jgi:prepilin-type N-terminal cleavage/methylation domain-containing protein